MRYWLSSNAMTIEVTTRAVGGYYDEQIIVKTPPIARKFVGQEISDLIRWMQKQGGFRMEELT